MASIKIGMAFAVSFVLFTCPQTASAGDTTVFTVGGVPKGDVLNIRSKPSAKARIVGKLKNGDQGFISLIDCWNSATGKAISANQLDRKKPNQWCAVMAGEDGEIRGFARYKFLK